MIMVKLKGGLGNQLFQYATGLQLAHKNHTKLLLDCFDYGPKKYLARDRARSYELNHFAITSRVALFPELVLYRIGARRLNPMFEKDFTFDSAIVNAPDNSYIVGHWQSYKYFESINELILHEFSFKQPPSTKNADILQKISKNEAVSIHIRRGDYITDHLTTLVLEPRPLEYYYKAINELTKSVKNPHFYVFSDDPVWVKNNLILNHPTTYIDHNQGIKAYEDLRLMSLCQHFIIANSTFSWWGAWLSQNPNKIVIAPKQWFRDTSKDTRDLIPANWLRM